MSPQPLVMSRPAMEEPTPPPSGALPPPMLLLLLPRPLPLLLLPPPPPSSSSRSTEACMMGPGRPALSLAVPTTHVRAEAPSAEEEKFSRTAVRRRGVEDVARPQGPPARGEAGLMGSVEGPPLREGMKRSSMEALLEALFTGASRAGGRKRSPQFG